jgi:hypothetical protein
VAALLLTAVVGPDGIARVAPARHPTTRHGEGCGFSTTDRCNCLYPVALTASRFAQVKLHPPPRLPCYRLVFPASRTPQAFSYHLPHESPHGLVRHSSTSSLLRLLQSRRRRTPFPHPSSNHAAAAPSSTTPPPTQPHLHPSSSSNTAVTRRTPIRLPYLNPAAATSCGSDKSLTGSRMRPQWAGSACFFYLDVRSPSLPPSDLFLIFCKSKFLQQLWYLHC